MKIEHTSKHHFGIGIAILVGFITALAATAAIVAHQNTDKQRNLSGSDNWEDALGI